MGLMPSSSPVGDALRGDFATRSAVMPKAAVVKRGEIGLPEGGLGGPFFDGLIA